MKNHENQKEINRGRIDIQSCNPDFRGGRSPTTVYADTVEHTHIWIDKYDSVNHWQECSICKTKQNVTVHTFEDHWYVDNSACGGKSSHKVCSCGYAYTYHPEHIINTNWYSSTSSVRCHFRICNNCKGWVQVGGCYNENGSLSCKNPGKCSLCGGTWSTGRHFLTNGGICADCKQRFYTITNETQIYSADYKTCDCSFDIIPENGVEVIDNSMFPSGTRNYSGFSRNLQKNADGSYTITWHFVLDEKLATKILYPAWRYDNIRIDGYPCYVIEDYMFSIWMDHTAPAVTNIVQTDQTSHDSWATAKRLDISGTEDYADIVVLSIIDKTTQHVVVNDAKIGVTDKKWSYTCTPDLEGGESGRTYTIRTKDVNGNISNTDFTVYNTDSASPQIESPLSYTDWTNTAKTITLTFTDYGSGDVQASLDNQTSYKACTKTADGKYQITYTFSDDIIGNKTYKLYLRDGLGNADSYDLIVGNIDKNTYNISYNLNGGSLSGQKTSYTVADSFTLPQPTRIGYTFTGWTGSNGTTPQKTVTVNKGTRGNLSYTANWQVNTYYLDLNGWLDGVRYGDTFGFGTFDVYIDGTLKANDCVDFYQQIPYGSKWEIKDVKAATGHHYNGVHSGSLTGAMGTSGVEIMLDFSTKKTTVTFYRNINSSDTTTAVQTFTYGAPGQSFSDKKWTKTGYTLLGWAETRTATAQQYSILNPVVDGWINDKTPQALSNVALYAVWSRDNYSISYTLNGGSIIGQPTSYNVESENFTLPQPTRTGYTFTGWTGTGLSGLTKTVTVAKGSTGNLSYTANWSANSCFITFDGNGGSLYISDPTIVKNNNGTATAKTWYDTNCYYILGIIPTRQGYTFKGFYDAPSGGTQVFKPYNPANCISVPSKYYNENNIWKYAGNVTFYAQWEPITWTTKYDANGGSGIMADTIHRFNCGDKIRHNQFIRPGWTMTGWTVSRVRDGVTEWHYGTSDGHWINGYSWYELGQNPPGTSLWVEHKLDTVDNSSTYIDGDIHTMHAQWQYNPVSVKVPQILTGDHTGTSQFRVKCDDLKAGNIKVAVPNSFLYKQAGKADVTAAITAKSGNNIITPSNKVCVYNITTRNGLSAGCWQGSFNIGLTLTKE